MPAKLEALKDRAELLLGRDVFVDGLETEHWSEVPPLEQKLYEKTHDDGG